MIENGRLGEFDIPAPFHEFVARSWEHDEHTIYGRFDLAYDGTGPPKLLEFNADTPTALLEAAVIQWFWFRDLLASAGASDRDRRDRAVRPVQQPARAADRSLAARPARAGRTGRLRGHADALEDVMTVTYLRDTAIQAGLKTEFLAVKDIGWHAGRRVFTDLRERAIEILFKLYPWEWMLREPFSRFLPIAPTRWLEPPWKMVLSNKAILPVLHELFPDSPYLLRAGFEPIGETMWSSRSTRAKGRTSRSSQDGRTIAETGGDYTEGPHVYQEFHPLPSFDGRYPVIGSWIVNGHACGMGIREDDGLITRNTSRFLPHLFRKSAAAKPPVMNPKGRQSGDEGPRPSTGNNDPLWDPWLDRSPQ